jgi:hypothetical protein
VFYKIFCDIFFLFLTNFTEVCCCDISTRAYSELWSYPPPPVTPSQTAPSTPFNIFSRFHYATLTYVYIMHFCCLHTYLRCNANHLHSSLFPLVPMQKKSSFCNHFTWLWLFGFIFCVWVKNMIFVFLSLAYLTQHGELHPFPWKWHNIILL